VSKYKGTIEFKSKAGLFVFQLGRWLARIAFVCTVVSAYNFRMNHKGLGLDITELFPTATFLVLWLLLKIAVNQRIKRSMIKEADRAGLSLWAYKKKVSKEKWRTSFSVAGEASGPQAKQREELRAERAYQSHRRTLNMRLEAVPRWRLSDRNDEERRKSFELLRAAQEQGQAIVDETCREYAMDEYGALNGNLSRYEVKKLLENENGRGPVTWAVDDIYQKARWEYTAYFDQHDSSWKGASKGYTEIQAADGSKKKVYRR
jgi:hypothetical protein